MQPTEEQSAIVLAAKETNDNLLIQAFAGAAKTSTLVLIAEALPSTLTLSLSFNKKIAVEMDARMPKNVTTQTLNSIGHRTWSQAISRRLKIDKDKTHQLVKQFIESQPIDFRGALYEKMGELMRLISFAKQCGFVPNFLDVGPWKPVPLMREDEFFDHVEQKLDEVETELITTVMRRSIELSFHGDCDYDDQVYMPTIFSAPFPRYKLVLVDEAQDLSALNHAMLKKIVGPSRLIAVGDPNQAIYGFRGAHENSMELLRREFSMRQLALTITFRCAKKIVEHARWKTPSMKYPSWAKEGKVTHLISWAADELEEDAAILCRNNAPLFRTAIRLLKNGRSAELDGRDIVNSITRIMKKFGSSDLHQQDVLSRIDAWLTEQKSKTKERGWDSLEDRAECMRIFAEAATDLGGALAYAQHVSSMHSPLKLLTGHKAKGLEFPHVYFLDEFLCKKKEQDPNVRYVIQTRAKNQLTYIRSEDFHDGPRTIKAEDQQEVVGN